MIPFCSVIVLNYFGEKILGHTLDSLLSLDYPKEKLEIIIIDNNSQDKSKEIILDYSKKSQSIKYKFLNKNLGFSGGNNQGIKIAKGDYVILLNNDCMVKNNWLTELVRTAQIDPKIFAVSSKIKLYPKYYHIRFNYINSIYLINAYLNESYLSKLENPRKVFLEILPKDEYCLLEVPYALGDKTISLELNFEISKHSIKKLSGNILNLQNSEAVLAINKRIIKRNVLRYEIKLDVSRFSEKNIYERIQNAGIVVFQDGSGRDIGAKIKDQRQYYEYDLGQYSKEKEVYAACGAAVLYNKKILDKIGLLDELFFMYYEDVEISERARLKGYKIYYSPKAEVRHLHAFSSKEWSNFFIYQVEKGRLLHVFFSFPTIIFLKEYIYLILRICEVGLRILKGMSDFQRVKKFIKNLIAYAYKTSEVELSTRTDVGKIVQYIKIIFYFIFYLPILIYKKQIKHEHISSIEISDNYSNILKGKWYFN